MPGCLGEGGILAAAGGQESGGVKGAGSFALGTGVLDLWGLREVVVRSLRGFPEGLGRIWGLCGSWGGASVEILVGLGAVELRVQSCFGGRV